MGLPLRLRLTLVFALMMGLILGGAGAFLHVQLGAALLHSEDLGLRNRATAIVAGVRRGDLVLPAVLGETDEDFSQVLDPAGSILDSVPAVSGGPLLPAANLQSVTHPTFFTRSVQGLEGPARLLAVPVRVAGRPEFVVVGSSLGGRQETLNEVTARGAAVGLLALMLTSGAGWVLAGAALRPVERMRREAEAISALAPEESLAVPRTRDELARLATTLNSLLARLSEATSRERLFIDQASHELRTPLSVLKTELELARSRPRRPAELEAALDRALADTDHVVQLSEDLLTLSAANEGRLPIHPVEVGLREVLEEVCANHRRAAEIVGVRVEVQAAEDIVRIDPVRLRQALDNLLDNCLHHVPPGGYVRVKGETETGAVQISVEDSGPGFPGSLLDHAFEPFARGNGSASNHEAGTGLGLAVVRAVASAHGGTATAENMPQGGARVTLVLRS